MNRYLSTKIEAISFLLIVMIVYLHSYSIEIKYKTESEKLERGYNLFIQEFISNGLCRVALPIFFMISGYLLFINLRRFDFDIYHYKVKKRLRTILLPYFLWSLYGILLYLGLQSIPFAANFFTNQPIVEYSKEDFLYTLLINPISYPIWFLRDLFILVIIAPVLYYLLKYYGLKIIILLLLTWVFEIDLIIVKFKSLPFFAIGMWLAISEPNYLLRNLSKKSWLFTLSWILLLYIKTTVFYYRGNEDILLLIHKVSVIIGIISLWSLFDMLFLNRNIVSSRIYPLFKFAFFIFVFHEPILTIIKKGLYFILGYSQLKALMIYFIAPILTIIICLIVAVGLKKLSPKFYKILTGNR
ncbi:acyltransferase [Aquimarina sp. ERC-38]|uniref:acyltransferase family protein n=1 Tax=Aquimarina sp. ERC-38 TaxID=2949996 RepID=UPI002247B740|nr:acyltransferase family protein [Aquimarina sp. ERC-38]UZO81454.1 acyltransferase [Aquimarina sp. ERC-38]